ncbi:MAG: PAS domain-containing protein [Pyramidobacter sp.]|nr:PAS domain-containing protein [Pyramidobacter sp.]
MEPKGIALTVIDRMILESWKRSLDGLAEYMGSGYEIVLHSLEDYEHSAIRVIHGEHTGRAEGAPITKLALDMLSRIEKGAERDYICYNSTNKDGKPLHSTTIAIRGENSRIIGLLCMNFYLDTPLSTVIAEIFKTPSSFAQTENYVQDAGEMVHDAVMKTAAAVDADGLAGSSIRNREIVRRLYALGIFSIKDSVLRVADQLGLSKNTVYLHLRHCKGERA